jgi:hypothetical protein
VDRLNQRVGFGLPDFDQWVLGGKTHDQIERELKSRLALLLDSVNRACQLSGGQREKLQLAGEGDMKRLHRTIEQFREKFREIAQDRQKFNTVAADASKLQAKMRSGVYDDSSLFQKVLRQTLNREQSVRYEQQELERRKFRYQAKIELFVSDLENNIALRAEQRQRLLKLLLDETKPPKKFASGQYDFFLVLIQAGKLGEAKLRPIFDDAQWQLFKKVLDEYHGMEWTLKSEGYLP